MHAQTVQNGPYVQRSNLCIPVAFISALAAGTTRKRVVLVAGNAVVPPVQIRGSTVSASGAVTLHASVKHQRREVQRMTMVYVHNKLKNRETLQCGAQSQVDEPKFLVTTAQGSIRLARGRRLHDVQLHTDGSQWITQVRCSQE